MKRQDTRFERLFANSFFLFLENNLTKYFPSNGCNGCGGAASQTQHLWESLRGNNQLEEPRWHELRKFKDRISSQFETRESGYRERAGVRGAVILRPKELASYGPREMSN